MVAASGSSSLSSLSDIEQRVALAGSNMLELLLFRLNPWTEVDPAMYGINILKVREIAQMPAITPLPNAAPGMLGVVNLRGQVIPVIDLARVMGHPAVGGDRPRMLLVTEFSRSMQGFAVEEVNEIVRLDWTEVKAADGAFSSTAITSFAHLGGAGTPERLVQVLDVEQVLRTVFPAREPAIDRSSITVRFALKPGAKVLAADDSAFARSLIERSLQTLGVPCQMVKTGQEAWDTLTAAAGRARQQGTSVRDEIGLVLTDLEMPAMDGFTLIRNMKDRDDLREIPVVIHSSLSGEASAEQGRRAGADTFVAKFVPNELAQAMHQALKRRGGLYQAA